MTTAQTDNIKLIVGALEKFGVTNKHIQAGILATVGKESNFIPQSENLKYSEANIKRVWPQTPQADVVRLAGNPQALGDYKYGNKGGNAANEGYKYRGRGYNQITFKSTYKKIGDTIGVDLVTYPDKLNDPKVAAEAMAAFFAPELKAGFNAGSFTKFGVTNEGAVRDTTTATKIAVQINAGRRTNFNNAVVQEGFNKAKGTVDSLYDMIRGGVDIVKKNPIKVGVAVALALGLLITGVVLIKNK